MDNDMDKDDLRKKVVNMFRVIAIQKYGLPSIPTVKTRLIWEKVLNAAESVIKTKASFDLIKESAQSIMKDPDHQRFFPSPITWEGEVRRRQRLKKQQNVEVDSEFEKGHQMSIARAKKRTEVVENYTSKAAREMEQKYIMMNPDKCIGKEGVYWGAEWEFYMALIRQDKDALDILSLYEKRTNRKTDRKCDT